MADAGAEGAATEPEVTVCIVVMVTRPPAELPEGAGCDAGADGAPYAGAEPEAGAEAAGAED